MAALAMFLTHATFVHGDASGTDHLAHVVAELRAIVAD